MEHDDENSFSNNIALYMFSLVSLILVSIDGIGLYNISLQWQQSTTFTAVVFEDCLKWQLITKSCFTLFSFFSAFSSFVICICLVAEPKYFVNKLLPTYMYYNYFIFGPIMLALCICGIVNWDNIANVCRLDQDNAFDRVFSFNNVLTLITCLIISLVITLLVVATKTVCLYVDSLTNGPDGVSFIRKIVYWVVLRTNSPSELIRLARNENNNTIGITDN